MSPPADNDRPDLPRLDVKRLLRDYNIRLKKSLGQNFLVSPQALQQVVSSADITDEDTVLEIGAGLGSLTRHLAGRASRVVTVEIDERLIPPLQEVLAPFPNVELVQGDILEINPGDLVTAPGYLVVANIPYYITSAIIRHLVEADLKPRLLVLTVQREVAKRICAGPGEMSLLAISVQVYGEPRVAARIPAEAFYPAPKVDSRVVRIDLFAEPLADDQTLGVLFRLAKAGFSQRRKTLRNSVSGGLGWPTEQVETLCRQGEIDPQRRAETLSVEEWLRLAKIVDGSGGLSGQVVRSG